MIFKTSQELMDDMDIKSEYDELFNSLLYDIDGTDFNSNKYEYNNLRNNMNPLYINKLCNKFNSCFNIDLDYFFNIFSNDSDYIFDKIMHILKIFHETIPVALSKNFKKNNIKCFDDNININDIINSIPDNNDKGFLKLLDYNILHNIIHKISIIHKSDIIENMFLD